MTLDHLSKALNELVPQDSPTTAPIADLLDRGRRARRLRKARSRAMVLTGVAATAAIASVFSIGIWPFADHEPAYAVARAQDGTVRVTVNEIGDPAEANRELAGLGVRAVIVPGQHSCPPSTQGTRVASTTGDGEPHGLRRPGLVGTRDGRQLTIRADDIPQGQVLVLTPVQEASQGEVVSLLLGFYHQPGPTCVLR